MIGILVGDERARRVVWVARTHLMDSFSMGIGPHSFFLIRNLAKLGDRRFLRILRYYYSSSILLCCFYWDLTWGSFPLQRRFCTLDLSGVYTPPSQLCYACFNKTLTQSPTSHPIMKCVDWSRFHGTVVRSSWISACCCRLLYNISRCSLNFVVLLSRNKYFSYSSCFFSREAWRLSAVCKALP